MDTARIQQMIAQAPKEVRDFIASKELDGMVKSVAEKNALNLKTYLPLKNVTILILVGAVEPSVVVQSIMKVLSLETSAAQKIANELNDTAFEQMRTILGTARGGVRHIEVGNTQKSTDSLRSSLLTPKPTAFVKQELPRATPQGPGSRIELMEQLALIGQVPRDADVLDRLTKIKDQLSQIEEERKKKDEEMEARVRHEKEKEGGPSTNYKRIYTADPYREQAD